MGKSSAVTVRRFTPSEHIRSLLNGEWVRMVDNNGTVLNGIRGRPGATGHTVEGVEIGADLIEMQPGSHFDLHTHSGQHVLYVIEGEGAVAIDGAEHPIKTGDTIFIPAEYVHGVVARRKTGRPLLLLSFGYPHQHVGADDRMKLHRTPLSAANDAEQFG